MQSRLPPSSVSSSTSGAPLLEPRKFDEIQERVVVPFSDLDLQDEFPPNIIITSRFNFLTFFPKSIFEQFRRLANVYFLVLGIIATVGQETRYYETAVEPAGILLPMCIVVMISIIKDGIEDVKRHQSDYKTNNRSTRIVDKDVGFFPYSSLTIVSLKFLNM
jgi:hypothetical protein